MSTGVVVAIVVVALVVVTLAIVYFGLIKGTRADNPPPEGEHRPGPGRS